MLTGDPLKFAAHIVGADAESDNTGGCATFTVADVLTVHPLRAPTIEYDCVFVGAAEIANPTDDDSDEEGDHVNWLAVPAAVRYTKVPRQTVLLVGLTVSVGSGRTVTVVVKALLLQPLADPETVYTDVMEGDAITFWLIAVFKFGPVHV
jgi:hypothetical protein